MAREKWDRDGLGRIVNIFEQNGRPRRDSLEVGGPIFWKPCTTSSIGRSMDTIRARNSASQDRCMRFIGPVSMLEVVILRVMVRCSCGTVEM
jgi:hypothetical protein